MSLWKLNFAYCHSTYLTGEAKCCEDKLLKKPLVFSTNVRSSTKVRFAYIVFIEFTKPKITEQNFILRLFQNCNILLDAWHKNFRLSFEKKEVEFYMSKVNVMAALMESFQPSFIELNIKAQECFLLTE